MYLHSDSSQSVEAVFIHIIHIFPRGHDGVGELCPPALALHETSRRSWHVHVTEKWSWSQENHHIWNGGKGFTGKNLTNSENKVLDFTNLFWLRNRAQCPAQRGFVRGPFQRNGKPARTKINAATA